MKNKTPLHLVLYSTSTRKTYGKKVYILAKLIISKGADINATDIHNQHYKNWFENKKIIKKWKQFQKSNKTPLHYATENNLTDTISLLLYKGANVHAMDSTNHVITKYFQIK